MKLLGERNWYLPRARGRVPSASSEVPEPAPAAHV
jgi:hypothetical protein